MGTITIKEKLTSLIQKEIRFEVSQDKLLVKGNLGILSTEDKHFLKDNKQAIMSLIKLQNEENVSIQKADEYAPKLLSFSQQSLWLLDKINNGSSHYNLSSVFKIKGAINYKALNQTFVTILKRHESLRTIFEIDASGNPIQKTQKIEETQTVVEEIDSSGKNDADLTKEIATATQKIFDLTKDLLLNVKLFKQSEQEHILVVTMHHIASDGWSMGILVNEFNVLYANFIKGLTNPLPKLTIQYADYALWQREWLKGAVLDEHLTYWKQQLANAPQLHNLPLKSQRPLIQTFNGSEEYSSVSKNALTQLRTLCQSEGASLFMGIHAVFSCLLSRYSNETDIVVGSPIANREKTEIANLVGFFMNLLVLRSDLSNKPSFRALLQQSKETLQQAYKYQQMPFERVVNALDVERNISHNPLFQVLLTLHNKEKLGETTSQDLAMKPLEYTKKSAKYDLSLNITEDTDTLGLTWEYNTDLFSKEFIIGMTESFNTLLTSLLANPDENVFNLNIVEETNISEISASLKGKEVQLETTETVISSYQNQLKNKANETAVISNDVAYSYKNLEEKVNHIAQLLANKGIKKGDKVGICMLRNVELVASIFACFKIGAAYVPLDPVYPAERLQQIIQEVNPECILTETSLQKLYLNSLSEKRHICLDTATTATKPTISIAENNTNGTAYIIFTSGSTGKPKGIEITHGNLTNLLKGFDISFKNNTQQKWLAQTSINFDISVLELIWTISRGQTIVLQQSNPFKLLKANQLNSTKKMDFSVMFFGADKSKEQKYDLLFKTVAFADDNDFAAIWTPERHFGEFGGAFPSPSVLSASLAAVTKRIGIRSGSVVLPLQDPIRVAEEWSLIDNLSHGRVGMSIASGWQPDDFVFADSNYETRHSDMKDKIEELKKLWKGIPIVRKNGINNDFEIKIRPKPIQKELPLWITAAGNPETFRYAGKIGANLLTHMLGQTLEILGANIAIYHQALEENGFKVEDKKVTIMLHTYIDSSEELALQISEKPFKEYLASSIKLMEPLAKELGIDVHSEAEMLIDIAYKKFSKENTLIGSPESCQKMLSNIYSIGITEVACLVDFGIKNDTVLAGLEKIVETKKRYEAYGNLQKSLHVDNQKTELDLIDEYEITHVQMTPSQSKLILDLHNQTKNKKITSVQHWFIGGEALNKTVVKGLSELTGSKFYNMYGPTETTVWSAWRAINSNDISIGEPVINTDFLLLNEFEQVVPKGVVGELCIGGLGVAKGYYKNIELTNEKFKNINTHNFGNSRFYKTGDLVKQNEHGTIDYIGRKDNQVKVNGYRVELEEIEKNITAIPKIKNCKVVPMNDGNSVSLSAFVVKEDIVYGDYTVLPEEKQAKPFHFADGSTIYHQSDRQLAMLYQEIIKDGIYFRHGITVPENGLVLDLGANIGTFSIDVNRRQPSAVVLAFEPIPQIFSGLKKNFEHRQIKGHVLNYGVSNKKEKATFHYYPEMAGMSGRFADKETILSAVSHYMEYDKKSLQDDTNLRSKEQQEIASSFYENVNDSAEFNTYLSSLYESEEVECQLTTVSDIIDELDIKTIDLLKLDVEKSECLVLDGIRSEHWSMIRHLAVEVDGDHNLDIIHTLLKEKGYSITAEELVMSDASAPQEENTYMLYATNTNHGVVPNDSESIIKLQTTVNENTISEALNNKLPAYMVPKEIIFVPTITLMGNGKVDLEKLKNNKPKKQEETKPVKLTNKTELEVYNLWCEVLKKEYIPHHISIFEAGGNSIEVVLLHEKLQNAFKVEFSLVELFRNPTIAQQAKLIQESGSQKESTAKQALDKGKSRRQARARTKRVK